MVPAVTSRFLSSSLKRGKTENRERQERATSEEPIVDYHQAISSGDATKVLIRDCC